MSARVTSLQVAELAGVSQSAVSRVFTPGASVSAKTAEKVKRAATKLGYRPNVLARAMVSGKSRIIGLVVAYLDNYFYPEALEKLSKALQARGYHVLVFMAAQASDNVDGVLQEILDYQVDGIVMASVSMSSDIATRCQAAGVPVTLFNRSLDMEGISSVTSDNHAGGRALGRFLAKAGHERIAYLAGWEGASTQRDREAGFTEALAEAGLAISVRAVGNYKSEEAKAATRTMFDVPPDQRPDALFAANDHMAFAAMDVIRSELGLRIPEDVSVVGFDDVPPAAWAAYDLTTVRQRANLMVDETVTALLEAIERPSQARPKQITIDAPLVVRGSARIPEGWTP